MSKESAASHQFDMPGYFRVVLIVAIVGLIVTPTVYVAKFGSEFAEHQSVWGAFGDYFGGLLNPIFSFLALIALLFTVALQHQQLKISTDELELTREELRKTAEAAAAQVDHFHRDERRRDLIRLIEILSERINRNFNENRLDDDRSVHWLIINHTNETQKIFVTGIQKSYRAHNTATYRAIKWLEIDLDRLSHLLMQYEEASYTEALSTPLLSFYQFEFGEMVNILHSYGMLPDRLQTFYCGEVLKHAPNITMESDA